MKRFGDETNFALLVYFKQRSRLLLIIGLQNTLYSLETFYVNSLFRSLIKIGN